MRLLSNVIYGLRSLFRKGAIESEMDEELRGFVEASTADKLRRGMTPDQAIRAARVEMGSANAVKHHIRSGAWETKVEIFWRDLWTGRPGTDEKYPKELVRQYVSPRIAAMQ
jgi:hypothetical protein